MKTVLVTGIGGAAGVSVLSSLARSGRCRLVGVDADEHARGQFIASEFHVIPVAKDERFIPSLLELSKGCDALFCTVDEELPLVAAASADFGCEVFVPGRESVENCLDKLSTSRILAQNGIPTPKTWPYEEREVAMRVLGFPLMVKPVCGRGGTNVFKVTNSRAMNAIEQLTDDRLLVQEYLRGPEFTVDVLADERAELRRLVVRERVRTKGGVTTVGRTVDPTPFLEPVRRVLAAFDLKYVSMVQFRSDPPRVMEVGPRPAGSMILSTCAGVNMPLMLLEHDYGQGPVADYQRDVWFYRHDGALDEWRSVSSLGRLA
jgi:carbamoyl-phosphate synthase large subunit